MEMNLKHKNQRDSMIYSYLELLYFAIDNFEIEFDDLGSLVYDAIGKISIEFKELEEIRKIFNEEYLSKNEDTLNALNLFLDLIVNFLQDEIPVSD